MGIFSQSHPFLVQVNFTDVSSQNYHFLIQVNFMGVFSQNHHFFGQVNSQYTMQFLQYNTIQCKFLDNTQCKSQRSLKDLIRL